MNANDNLDSLIAGLQSVKLQPSRPMWKAALVGLLVLPFALAGMIFGGLVALGNSVLDR